jgi:membrane-bound inhibitor of C-type lysozyme
MRNTGKIIVTIIIVILIVVAIVWAVGSTKSAPVAIQTQVENPIATVAYACNDNKTIDATFYIGSSTVALSDGRTMSLSQATSADGTRYTNSDESFVFWSMGKGALVLENNVDKSYIGCVSVAPDPGGLSNIYQNGGDGISLRYPVGYTVDRSYKYQALGPNKTISGTKFTIPAALAQGTNLSPDSYMSVESIPKTSPCTASPFIQTGAKAQTVTDGSATYSTASTTGAAAGNRYEETVYALPGTKPCVAVRYFVHYGAIDNYPAGTVREFDRQALLAQFDQIRKTLTVNQ